MQKGNTYALKIAIICLVSILVLLSSILEPLNANARTTISYGGGGGANNGKVAGWDYVGGNKWSGETEDTTNAWKHFVKVAKKSWGSEASVISTLSGLSTQQGFKFEGKTWNLVTSCKRSKYIWWYGDDSRWYSKAGKNDPKPPTGMDGDILTIWKNFTSMPKSKTGWGTNRGPVIVCSAPWEYGGIGVGKKKVTLQADSLTVYYDGNKHTVTGWKVVQNKSDNLRPGDTYDVKVETSRTKPGEIEVPFEKAIIRNKNGTNVTDKYYKVTEINGLLTIIKKDKWKTTSEREERCRTTGNDQITAVTKNKLQAIPVDIPGTASDVLYEISMSEPNQEAVDIIKDMPGAGDTKAEWVSWREKLREVKSNRDIEVDLTALTDDTDSFSETFSKYGGVLDIKLSETKKRMFATFCQPEYRVRQYKTVTHYDKNGKYAGSTTYDMGFGPWKEMGERLIEDTDGPKTLGVVRKGYQILHVNCNKEEFYKVENQVAYKVEKSTVSGTSATLYTKKKKFVDPEENINIPEATFFDLGRTISPSNQTKFYTEGPDCKDNIFCTVEKGTGNDSSNNDVNEPLFQHVNKNENEGTQGYGKTENGVITFFRDNENRTVRADLWHPVQGGIVPQVDPEVRASYFKIHPDGTPDFDVTTIQLLPENLDPSVTPGAKGFVDKEIKSDNEAQNPMEKLDTNGGEPYSDEGEINRLNFKSQWASNDNKPHKVSFNWIYNVTLKRNVLSVVNQDKATIIQDEGTSEVEVGCEFLNTPGKEKALVNDNIFVNTGILDSTLKLDNPENSVKVMFSRAISEKRD